MSYDNPKLRALFLTLWDKAVETPKYDKNQWMRLEQLIGVNSVRPPSYYIDDGSNDGSDGSNDGSDGSNDGSDGSNDGSDGSKTL